MFHKWQDPCVKFHWVTFFSAFLSVETIVWLYTLVLNINPFPFCLFNVFLHLFSVFLLHGRLIFNYGWRWSLPSNLCTFILQLFISVFTLCLIISLWYMWQFHLIVIFVAPMSTVFAFQSVSTSDGWAETRHSLWSTIQWMTWAQTNICHDYLYGKCFERLD